MRRAVPLFFVTLGLLGTACSEDEPPPPPPSDLGPQDLAVDLGRDLGMDVGSLDDGGPDAAADAGMVQCDFEDPDMLGSETASVFQRVAITSFVNDFAVVFRERRPTFDDLWVRVYRDTSGGVVAGADFPITTNAAGMSVSSVSRDPALVATDTGYVAAWIDSRESGFEMWTRALDADGVPAASLQRVTTSDGAAASPALARASDGTLLAGHIHDDTQSGTTREWSVATMGTTGVLTSSWTRASAAGELTSQGMLVPGLTTGFLSGWVDGAGNARVRTVDVAGTPTNTAVTHSAADLFALNSAVLVFGRNDGFDGLWAQAITATGATDGLFRSLLTNDATGRDHSVADLNGGVVVAYRHTTMAGTVIALALLNSRGELTHTELLGATTSAGGPISVAVNNEGRIRLAWAEVEAGTTTTYTQAVQCDQPL